MSDPQLEFEFEEFDRKSVPELWTVDEIYDEAKADGFDNFYEDGRFERKRAVNQADKLAISVCMWANTPPDGGIVAIGIADDGQMTGCSSRAQELVEIERRIRSDLVPDAVAASKRVLVTNASGTSDFVLLYRVQYREDKVVETNKEEAYIRRANSCHLLTPDEKRELQMERGQLSFELEPCHLEWPDRFDLVAVKAWAAAVHRAKKVESEPLIPQILVNHKLGKTIKGQFAPNNACALLFARDPQEIVPGCMLRFQRIEGKETATGKERNVVRDVPVTGTIPQIIEIAGQTLETQLRVYSRLGKGGKFYTAPEYPEEAWHEAIVNACVHRSYSLKGANVFVRMFDDRLVVESPGGFPPMVTPKNIYDIHHRRNWWLMDALFFLDYVKCENEGAKRIRRAMADMNLPEPEFEQKQIGGALVRVTLRNNQHVRKAWIDADVSSIIGPERAAALSDIEKRAINFAAEHEGKIKATDCMNLMTSPRWGTAKKVLERLVEKKIFRFASRYPHDPIAYYLLDVQPHGQAQ
jgi:ATP-dependent DNA helicase RecG